MACSSLIATESLGTKLGVLFNSSKTQLICFGDVILVPILIYFYFVAQSLFVLVSYIITGCRTV